MRLLLEVSPLRRFSPDACSRIETPKAGTGEKTTGYAAGPALECTRGRGTFFAAVGNAPAARGSDYLYRLSLTGRLPGLKAVAANNAIVIEPGKTNEIKITITTPPRFQIEADVFGQGAPGRAGSGVR